ncbi:MAG: NAD(P)-binding domain-containing protein [Dehalococcoidales bacterium]|nr:NAD(P)-binding domain-containing protein [Dehalococcoidales bacterium]
MEIKKVGILGFTGPMGRGIAQVCAQSGYEVVGSSRSEDRAAQAIATIDKALSRSVERGRMEQADKDAAIARIKGTASTQDFADCDLVIEAAAEKLDVKIAAFKELDGICKEGAILASNTSVLPLVDMAVATKRQEKVIGLHFFNPVSAMKLVEIIKPITVSEETATVCEEFIASLGKTVVSLPDTPGFIVNRLAVGFMLNAISLLENGVASKEDIDTSIKLGLNHPMGPLELADLIGNDIVLDMADGIYTTLKESRYIAPNLLRRMVAAGWLGQKTKKGFYDYNK